MEVKEEFIEGQSSLEDYFLKALRKSLGRNSESFCKEKDKVTKEKREIPLLLENGKKIYPSSLSSTDG